MTARTALEMLAAVREESAHPTLPPESGWCLKYSRIMGDVAAKYATAYLSGINANCQPTAPPAGSYSYWRNPDGSRSTAGHIAPNDGQGNCYSTDIRRTGRFDLVPIPTINREWGLIYMGWSYVVNDVELAHGEDQQQGGDHHEFHPPTTDEDDMPDMQVREGDPAMSLNVEGCNRLVVSCAIDTYAEITEIGKDGQPRKPIAWDGHYGDDNRLGILAAQNHVAGSPLRSDPDELAVNITVGRVSGGPLYVRAYKAA